MEKMKNEYKLLITIFLFALVIRIVFVYAFPVKWWDETVYANLGYDLSKNPFHYSFDGKWSDFVPGGEWPKAGFRPPLLPYLLALFYFLKLNFLIDFLIPLFGALTTIVVYFFGRKLFDKKTAIFSSLFFAFMPLHIYYSGRIMNDVLASFLILLSFFVFWKAYEENNKRYKLLFGIVLALSLLARYTSLWIFPVFLFYFLIKIKLDFLKDRYFYYSVLVFFVVLSPLLIYGIVEYKNPLGAFIHGLKASSYWGGTQSFDFFIKNFYNIFSIIGIVFIFSLFYIIKNKEYKKKEVYLLLLFIFFFFFLASAMKHKEDRFLLPIIPAICLIVGNFVSKLKKFKIILVVFILGFLVFSTSNMFVNTYKTYYNVNSACFLPTINYLNKFADTNSVLISENPPILYYYTKQENSYYPNEINKASLKEIEQWHNKKLYFVFNKLNSGFETDKWKNLKELLKENYELLFTCSLDTETNFIYSN